MKSQFKKRLLRTAILSLIAFIVGGGIAITQINNERKLPPPPVAGVEIGGAYSLVDHNGQDVSADTYAGRPQLIYFGFTYCPAICPTELQKITKVLNMLGPKGENIQPLFVTIDPERDTAPVMREYVSLFHPRLIGLTGNQKQIDDALKSFRVFAKKVQDPQMNDYTMDHSSFIYLMGKDGQLISIYRIKDDAAYIVQDIKAKI
ncbi:MAG: SCO family protein [Pseudomonadota bacterium]